MPAIYILIIPINNKNRIKIRDLQVSWREGTHFEIVKGCNDYIDPHQYTCDDLIDEMNKRSKPIRLCPAKTWTFVNNSRDIENHYPIDIFLTWTAIRQVERELGIEPKSMLFTNFGQITSIASVVKPSPAPVVKQTPVVKPIPAPQPAPVIKPIPQPAPIVKVIEPSAPISVTVIQSTESVIPSTESVISPTATELLPTPIGEPIIETPNPVLIDNHHKHTYITFVRELTKLCVRSAYTEEARDKIIAIIDLIKAHGLDFYRSANNLMLITGLITDDNINHIFTDGKSISIQALIDILEKYSDIDDRFDLAIDIIRND